MPVRRRPARPVEILLTEEDLAAIIEETSRPGKRPGGRSGARAGARGRRAAPGGGGPEAEGPPGGGGGSGSGSNFAGTGEGDGGYAPISESVQHRGIPRPGAVGDAIRRILEATNLDPGKPSGGEEEE